MNKEERTALRKEKILARDSLTIEQREAYSQQIVKRILASGTFAEAKTIMIYRGIRGEVRLNALEIEESAKGKRFVFPLCIGKNEMIALLPQGEDAWQKGYCGIEEPIREKSFVISPEDIDMVICPCTVFDENCGRMGMGAGFYDRYLEKCTNAVVTAAAFEVQKAEKVPMEPWDKPMKQVFTEKEVYCKK